MGYSKERVIHSPCAGIMKNVLDIGDVVEKDEVIAYIGEYGSKSNNIRIIKRNFAQWKHCN